MWLDLVSTVGTTALVLGTAALLFYGWQSTRREERQIEAANRLRYTRMLGLLNRVKNSLR